MNKFALLRIRRHAAVAVVHIKVAPQHLEEAFNHVNLALRVVVDTRGLVLMPLELVGLMSKPYQ